jgi:hypothetical protein
MEFFATLGHLYVSQKCSFVTYHYFYSNIQKMSSFIIRNEVTTI